MTLRSAHYVLVSVAVTHLDVAPCGRRLGGKAPAVQVIVNETFSMTLCGVIAAGLTVTYYPINGTWIDIGSPTDFRQATELMRQVNAMHRR